MAGDHKNFVRNTQEEDPVLATMLRLSGLNSTENDEARGAAELRRSEVLPTDMGDRAPYEEMGIVFGEIVEKDPLFIYATLPPGWKKVSSERDPRHMHILDETGKERVYIFYKAASYDRKASMSPA